MKHSHTAMTLSALSATCAMMTPMMATATTYYVSSSGKDTNSGSQAAPLKTFKKSVGLLQPGDTLLIRGGTYTEQIDLQGPNKTGTASGWITIAGHPGETVVLQHAATAINSYGAIKARGARGYFIFENLIIDGINETNGTTWNLRDGNHHFILRNIEMKRMKSIGLGIAGHDIQVINSRIHDSPTATALTGPTGPSRRYGMYIRYGNNIVIEGNEIYNQPGGGIHAFPGPLRNLVIRNNIIHHNNSMPNSPVPGILVWGDSLYVKDGRGYTENAKVYNNVVYANCVNNPSRGCGGIWVSGDDTRNTKVWNNTIYGNKGYGINVAPWRNGRPTNTILQNNISFGNTTQQIIDSGSNTTISKNLTINPQFVNAAGGDFRLQAGSPAINTGAFVGEITTDIRGVRRSLPLDVGAYEAGAGQERRTPKGPRNLVVR